MRTPLLLTGGALLGAATLAMFMCQGRPSVTPPTAMAPRESRPVQHPGDKGPADKLNTVPPRRTGKAVLESSPVSPAATPPISPALGKLLTQPASAERQAAQEAFRKIDSNGYSAYDIPTLRTLSGQNDTSAQEALAARLFMSEPDEALKWAKSAAAVGRPIAATLVAEILARKRDPSQGYEWLLEFQQKHGPNPIVDLYTQNYLARHLNDSAIMKQQATQRSD